MNDFTAQARQLVKRLSRWRSGHFMGDCAGDACPDWIEEQAKAIASFASEAATQGQATMAGRTVEAIREWERHLRKAANNTSYLDGYRKSMAEQADAADEIRSIVESLSPDPSLLDRVRAEAATAALEQAAQNRPKIICLCGSTRFVQTWIDEYQRLSDEGNIVLTVARMPPRPNLQHDEPELKRKLDGLHFHKIALADEVFILNVGGYIGESTAREIEHAMNLKKTIRWLEQPIAAIGDDRGK